MPLCQNESFFLLKCTSIMHKVYIKIDRLLFLEILSFYICLLLQLSSFMLLVAGYLYYCFALDLSWHKCKEHSYFPSNSGPFTLFTLRSLSDIIFTLAYTLSLTYFPYFVYVCLVFPGSNFIKVTGATSCYFENVCVYW